jgi:hypothetical protein
MAETHITKATPINHLKTTIDVFDGQVKQGGLFTSNYVVYKVVTMPVKWEVTRKEADF